MKSGVRAEHIGSLLRPPQLLEARVSSSSEQLREAEDAAIREAVRKQREIGLDILTDGEMRRGAWLTDMAEAVDGFVAQKVMLDWKGPGGAHEASAANAVGAKLCKTRQLTGLEIPLMRTLAPGEFKVTLPAPSNFMLSSYKPGLTEQFYPTHADLLRDLVDIVRDEVDWLVGQGVTYIQFDAPFYSHYLDPRHREAMEQQERDPDAELEQAIAADNESLKNVPSNVTKALHVCRGNNRSRWYTEGGYGRIAEKLFGSAEVDRFLLEFDDERSGDFEPLKQVPRGKTVVLGLITTKSPHMETLDELRRRVDDAGRYIPLENLAISPQCGFASVAAGNLISPDIQWQKLRLVVATARKIWG
jgi:5-methyltetrahydropteroyltriglutamate--homocysteine methyltransferase